MRKARSWLVVLAAALVGVTTLSSPAMAAPNAVVTPAGDHGHTCRALGNDGINQAVICVDLLVSALADGVYVMQGQAEAVCQSLSNKNSFPQCANVTVWIAVEDQSLAEAFPDQCGHANGPCASPRVIAFSPPWQVADGHCFRGVWGAVWAIIGNGPRTAIELPASSNSPHGRTIEMSTNLNTPEFNVGNGC